MRTRTNEVWRLLAVGTSGIAFAAGCATLLGIEEVPPEVENRGTTVEETPATDSSPSTEPDAALSCVLDSGTGGVLCNDTRCAVGQSCCQPAEKPDGGDAGAAFCGAALCDLSGYYRPWQCEGTNGCNPGAVCCANLEPQATANACAREATASRAVSTCVDGGVCRTSSQLCRPPDTEGACPPGFECIATSVVSPYVHGSVGVCVRAP